MRSAFRDAHFVREAPEVGAIRIAARHARPEQLSDLHRHLEAQVRAVAGDGAATFAVERELRHHVRMVLSSLPAIRRTHPEYVQED